MPTYEYVCQKCGHEFEVFQSMRDEPFKKCPQCKKAALKRLVGGGAGLIFKGSGFYITDYKNKDSAAKEKRAGTGESKPVESKPVEAKSSGEAKPAGESKPTPAKPAAASEKKSPSPQK